MQPLIYRIGPDAYLLVECSVLKALARFKQCTPSATEAGGILIGSYRDNHIHIVDATTPQSGDIRTRFSFYRRSPEHQAFATRAWNSSRKTRTVVGEWHTHPENHPSPSTIDLAEWRREPGDPPLIFLIQGLSDLWLGRIKGGACEKIS